ncbi:MAG: recombinase family protein [Phenylobacterium zucineum]|nr:MAG: recombinase family protein [Phenylobacterium zucineum]
MSQPQPLLPAAQYLRMSREHQRYSIEGQRVANAAYAAARGISIVRSYIDDGVSGLRIERRAGLKALIADVVGGAAPFELVLVYDVSRWGRFQDPDEAAHYEFLCREAGVQVEYTAETFDNDGSLVTVLAKHLKRAMAAEYSRELAAKVRSAKRGIAQRGFWTGGEAPYGYRRCEVLPDGALGHVFERGERKYMQGRRTVLVRGPEAEVAVVRRIFHEAAVERRSAARIAHGLNRDGIARYDRGWRDSAVIYTLTDETYIGVLVCGKHARGFPNRERLPSSQRIRVEGACPALVDAALFHAARAHPEAGWYRPSREQLLEELRALLATHGRLSCAIINASPGTHASTTFSRRFGGLLAAYRLAGYEPSRRQVASDDVRRRQAEPPWVGPRLAITDMEILERLRRLLDQKGELSCSLIDECPALPSSATVRARFGDLRKLYLRLGHVPSHRQELTFAMKRTPAASRPRRPSFRTPPPLAVLAAQDLGDE